jgi:hypothetical protein
MQICVALQATAQEAGARGAWHNKLRPISSTILQVISTQTSRFVATMVTVLCIVYGKKPAQKQKDHREQLLVNHKPVEKMAGRRTVRRCPPTTRRISAQHAVTHRAGLAAAGGSAEDDPEPGLCAPLAARPARPGQHRRRGHQLRARAVPLASDDGQHGYEAAHPKLCRKS